MARRGVLRGPKNIRDILFARLPRLPFCFRRVESDAIHTTPTRNTHKTHFKKLRFYRLITL